MKKTRIFAFKKSIKSEQLGCWADSFIDVEFQENFLVKITVQHVAKGMIGRTHTFEPAFLPEDLWAITEPMLVESCIEY